MEKVISPGPLLVNEGDKIIQWRVGYGGGTCIRPVVRVTATQAVLDNDIRVYRKYSPNSFSVDEVGGGGVGFNSARYKLGTPENLVEAERQAAQYGAENEASQQLDLATKRLRTKNLPLPELQKLTAALTRFLTKTTPKDATEKKSK